MNIAQHEQAWLRLALAPEIGPVLGHRLIEAFGSPEAVFDASAARLREVPGLGPARAARLHDRAVLDAVREEARLAHDAGVRLVPFDAPEYPPALRALKSPPLLLWLRGQLEPFDRLALAIVGPRTPSNYARLMAAHLAPALARQGLALVSGLAHGIDAEVHKAALDCGGRTLAVVGQGLGTAIYPAAHETLAQRIVGESRGALISIFPMATEPAPGLFPQRNEVIAALALGTLIVEASPNSGSLITARHALALGRPVLACPGDATRRAAQGSNRLIAEGAALVQTPEDVLTAIAGELRVAMQELDDADGAHGLGGADACGCDQDEIARRRNAAQLDLLEALEGPAIRSGRGVKPPGGCGAALSAPADPLAVCLLGALAAEPLPIDLLLECAAQSGHALPAVMSRLLELELDGRVRQLPGRLYALAPPLS